MSKLDWFAIFFLIVINIFAAADSFGYGVIAFVPRVLIGCYLLYRIAPKDKPKA